MLEGERKAVAVWTAVAAVGGASGLLVGGAVAGAFGWRWIFLINLPVGLIALACTPTLSESRAPRRRLAINRRVASAALVGAILTAATSSGAVLASLQLQHTLTPEQAGCACFR